jgi:tetratricopeptide (TPR) repeat protein
MYRAAVLLRLLGRWAESETYLRAAVEKNRRAMGEAHPYRIAMTRYLSDVLRDQGKSAEAEETLRLALERMQRVHREDQPEIFSVIGALVGALRDQGKVAEAEPICQQAIEKCRRLYGEDDTNTLTAILGMAGLRVAQGKLTEALSLLTPIEEKVRKLIAGSSGSLRHATLLGLRGRARAALAKEPGEFSAAEVDLLEAQSVVSKISGDKGKENREWMQSLVDLYAAWDRSEAGKGYDAKAVAWKTKLTKTTIAPPREKK